MSVFSHSAPYLSIEKNEEELDLSKLSLEERESILEDKYGRNRSRRMSSSTTLSIDASDVDDDNDDTTADSNSNNNGDVDDDNDVNTNNNNDDITEELLDKYFDALIAIPPEEKEDYTFVSDYFPHLIREESHPNLFLRAVKYNPVLAARRQVEYWKMRLQVFEEHAFDRMTLDGAAKHLIPYLVQIPNFFRILPEDDNGRTILCFDRTNIRLKDYDEMIFLKIIWFVFHQAILSRGSNASTNGIVLLIINNSSSWEFPSRNILKLCYKSLFGVMQARLVCRHVCISSIVFSYILPVANLFISREGRLRSIIHNNSLKNCKTLNELEEYGMCRSNLPKSIGGSYNDKQPWANECERILREQEQERQRQKEGNHHTHEHRRKRQRGSR